MVIDPRTKKGKERVKQLKLLFIYKLDFGMNESELSYSYEAFISYRQVEPDKTIAERLHRALETYKVPRSLIKEGMPRRLKRIFRDKEELAASSNLGENIQKALKQSRFLIVVCSRKTPESEWVTKEIETFCEFY